MVYVDPHSANYSTLSLNVLDKPDSQFLYKLQSELKKAGKKFAVYVLQSSSCGDNQEL